MAWRGAVLYLASVGRRRDAPKLDAVDQHRADSSLKNLSEDQLRKKRLF